MGSGANDYAGRAAARRRILVVAARSHGSLGIAEIIRELGDVSLKVVELRDNSDHLCPSEGPWDLIVLSAQGSCRTAANWLRQRRRAVGRAPIAVIAPGAHAQEVDELLDAGADDVVTVPTLDSPALARITALLRATSGMYPATAAAAQLPQAAPDITLRGTELRVQGIPIQLTLTEAALVAALLERRRQWRTAAELLHKAFELPMAEDTSLVRVHVFNIRKKLGGLAYCLQGRRRFGYRIL